MYFKRFTHYTYCGFIFYINNYIVFYSVVVLRNFNLTT